MRWGESSRRGMVIAALAGLAIAVALISWRTLGKGSAAEASPADFDVPAQGLVLRLHDLPSGYWATEGSGEFPLPGLGCAAIEPAEPRPRLAAFLDRFSPVGCLALYLRLYRVPDGQPAPRAVGTGALETGNVEGAEAGLAASRELLGHLLGDELPREVPAPETVGDATRLYRWEPQRLFSSRETPSSFLVWRSGSVVAAIFATGPGAVANDRAALHYARVQQARIENPTPYTPQEADDTEVALENPALKVPVYWLGRTFAPGHGVRPLRLYDAGAEPRGRRVFGHPSQLATLLYVDRLNLDRAEGVELDIWSRAQWRRLRNGKGELPGSLRCATSRRLKLPDGRAELIAGFENVRRGACPTRRPRTHTARVYLPGAVVTVETQHICATCFGAGPGPYDSFRGMATIARGLEPRIRRLAAP